MAEPRLATPANPFGSDMSNPGDSDDTPIASIQQLADLIAVGCKPPEQFRIGTEHEKFGFRRADLAPPAYEPGGIRDVLTGLLAFGGEAILDHGQPIGIKLPGGASVSLEPAGQLELSGAPLLTLHDTRQEFDLHLRQVHAVAGNLGLGFSPIGFHPLATRDEMPWMPKGRYAIMRRYMPTVGTRGLDMMTRTCTVQVNLDYSSEDEMRRKLRVSLALQPLATALFANSPFTEGRPNGMQSARANVWLDTDNQRSGIPAVMFEDGYGFERHAQWLVDEVPMYFVHRDGGYIDVAGKSFRDFMDGRIPELAGEIATVSDFADHLTTAFTDVRLKQFLEMRGADAGTPAMMLAQSALWVGLLYDDAALAAAESLVAGVTHAEIVASRAAVPRLGLAAPFRGGTLRDIAADAVAIAATGLRSRGRRNALDQDESAYLDPVAAIAAGAPTQADRWLERYRMVWNGSAMPILIESAT